MDPFETFDPMFPARRVVASPDIPGPLREAVDAKARSVIGDLPTGANGAFVGIITDDGTGPTMNLAVIAHINGVLDVAGYVGKKWGKPRPEFGAQIRWTF